MCTRDLWTLALPCKPMILYYTFSISSDGSSAKLLRPKSLESSLTSFLFMTPYNQPPIISIFIPETLEIYPQPFPSSCCTTHSPSHLIFCLDYCTRWVSLITFLPPPQTHIHSIPPHSNQNMNQIIPFPMTHLFLKFKSSPWPIKHYIRLPPKPMITILSTILIALFFFSNTQRFTSGAMLILFPLFITFFPWLPGRPFDTLLFSPVFWNSF